MKKLIEITRSFSYKLNVGKYETRDFFCAQKAECYEDEADKVSDNLHEFCKQQVINAVNDWKKGMVTVEPVTPEEEYEKMPKGEMKVAKPKPGEIEAIIKRAESVSYRATDKHGGFEKIIKEDLQPY